MEIRLGVFVNLLAFGMGSAWIFCDCLGGGVKLKLICGVFWVFPLNNECEAEKGETLAIITARLIHQVQTLPREVSNASSLWA